MKYFKPIKSHGNTFSCDMIRIDFDMGNNTQAFSDWTSNVQGYDAYIDVDYYHTFKPFAYEHLWTFHLGDESSWSVGLSPGNRRTEGFIEFNPNKCATQEGFLEWYGRFLGYCYTTTLKRYDLAIDIPIDRSSCCLVKDHRKYAFISDKTKTEYLGQRNKPGFVKLYDKAAERKLDYPLTRLEVTCCPGEHPNIPELRIAKYQTTFDDNLLDVSASDRVIYDLARQVENPYPILKKLSPRRFKRIKDLLENDQEAFEMPCDVLPVLRDVMNEFLR